jgi:uncharacterized protein YhaN
MAEPNVQSSPTLDPANGAYSLDARLALLFAEQRRLRAQLEQTRAELDRVNREVLRVHDEFSTDADREEEYRQCVQRLLGFDPHVEASEIEDAKQDPQSAEEFLAELESRG